MESGRERELVPDVIDVESGGNMSSITGSQEIGEIRLKPRVSSPPVVADEDSQVLLLMRIVKFLLPWTL